MKAALSTDMLATDLAEYLVRKGVPFRETHHISGQAVRMAEERGCSMSELSVKDLKTLHELFEDDVLQVWDYERSIEQRSSLGGTSRKTVLLQIQQLRKMIE
jgi:argininosuccinate lyase